MTAKLFRGFRSILPPEMPLSSMFDDSNAAGSAIDKALIVIKLCRGPNRSESRDRCVYGYE